MRIVITGASGNVGSALLRRLVEDGRHELVGVARRLPEDDTATPELAWVAADLTRDDPTALRDVCDGADAVVHLAWAFQPSHREDHLRELGVGGTRRVMEAVVAARVPHLVHMSSVGAYSPKRDDAPVDETWPTGGVPTSMYSRHKAAAERLLDEMEDGSDVVVTRVRPGIIGQRGAASALLRYGLPALVPAGLLRHVPVLPIDERLVIPMVHADDVAEALVRVIGARTPGAFNLAADPPVTAQDVADALDAHLVHVPSGAVRAAVSASWHARVQPLDPGWIDMGCAVPLLDTTRARTELGWEPRVDGTSVLAEVLGGMQDAASSGSPVLRRRTVWSSALTALRRGPVSSRREP
jgi:UDP-glucose 4-epimerase